MALWALSMDMFRRARLRMQHVGAHFQKILLQHPTLNKGLA
jgi:hypothetical protein